VRRFQKGQFRLGNREYCYPLTVTDHYSRFIIGCIALDGTKHGPTQLAFEELFAEWRATQPCKEDAEVAPVMLSCA